jgi:putative ABC transport system ATP-binding protein
VSLLRLENVSRYYDIGDSRVKAVDRVTLDVETGECLAILGASGSGKTTLLQLCAGLDRPDGGTVTLRGQDLASFNSKTLTHLRRREFGFIFQSFNLVPGLDALENVALPLRFAGRRKTSAARRATELLGAVGLLHRCSHLPSQLSGGEMQRVAVARAMAMGPSLLFADEPTGNLDRSNGDLVVELIVQCAREAGAGVIVVSHDPHVSEQADRILEMRDGRLSPRAVPRAVMARSELTRR